jgi:predicted flap endonuclease-1-like 5' DNA nuclease
LPHPPPLIRLPFRPSAQPPTAAPSKAPGAPRPTGPPRAPSSLLAEAKPHKSELEQLRTELAARDSRIGELELRLREHDEFARELAACDARLDQLSRYCGGVERIRHQLHEAVAAVDELVAKTSCISELEERIARLESRAQAPAPASPLADDLKRISGIGPALERALHDLGVRTYAEIAAWSADDVERIARLLRVKVARVQGWPEQARTLAPPQPGG